MPCPTCLSESRWGLDRCNDPYHRKDRKPVRHIKKPMRFLSDRGDTVRGDCDLTDMEPEERAFGGPGKVVVPVGLADHIDPPAHADKCDDEECDLCHPKRKQRRKAKA